MIKASTTMTKEEARRRYGDIFADRIMRGKNVIVIDAQRMALLEKFKLIRESRFTPYAYEYVYVVFNPRHHFKIGMSGHPRTRMKGLLTGTTDELTLRGIAITGWQNGRNIERALHNFFTKKGAHLRGEWFDARSEPGEVSALREAHEFILTNYGRKVWSLTEAYEGSEPMMDLYRVAKPSSQGQDVAKLRAEFLWVAQQVRDCGLTILS